MRWARHFDCISGSTTPPKAIPCSRVPECTGLNGLDTTSRENLIVTAVKDLPNEILLGIFSHLEPTELHAIFASSRVLNKLAFIEHRRRHKLQGASQELSLTPLSLRGYCAALYPPHVRKLSVTLDSAIIRLPEDIRRLQRFCQRVEPIPDVVLDLGQDVLSDDLSDHERETISRAIQDLLLTLTAKVKPVVRVTTLGIFISESTESFRPEINRYSPKHPPRTKQQVEADRDWEVLIMALIALILAIQPTNTLARLICLGVACWVVAIQYSRYRARLHPLSTTVDAYNGTMDVPSLDSVQFIHISTLTSPHLQDWSLITFNCAEIHSLRIRQPITVRLSTEEWGAILSCIHLPSLFRLTISQSHINVADVFSFLARHATITEMVYTPTAMPHPPPQLPLHLLPHLSLLRASPEFIGLIHETPGAFPNLEKIEFFIYLRDEPFVEPLKWALRKMVSRLTDVHLEIVIPADTPHSNWLTEEDEGGGPDFTLPCVKKLSLFWFATSTVAVIPKWLVRFPSVVHLKLADVKLPREQQLDFIRGIRSSCPHLQRLSIGASEFSLSDWINILLGP